MNSVLLIGALVANWRDPRRRWVFSAAGTLVLAGLFVGLVKGPLPAEILAVKLAAAGRPITMTRAPHNCV